MMTPFELQELFTAIDKSARAYETSTAGMPSDDKWRKGMEDAVRSVFSDTPGYQFAVICDLTNNDPYTRSRGEWCLTWELHENVTNRHWRVPIRSNEGPVTFLMESCL